MAGKVFRFHPRYFGCHSFPPKLSGQKVLEEKVDFQIFTKEFILLYASNLELVTIHMFFATQLLPKNAINTLGRKKKLFLPGLLENSIPLAG